MSKPTVSIDKISITLGNKKLELTLEEARELKRILNETLEPKNVYNVPAVIDHHPYREYLQPPPMWGREPDYCKLPQITC